MSRVGKEIKCHATAARFTSMQIHDTLDVKTEKGLCVCNFLVYKERANCMNFLILRIFLYNGMVHDLQGLK